MHVYNTMTRTKEKLVPLEEGHFKIYTCGPTVYNYFHLGNARPFIIYDTLRRYLEYKGYQVTYVQNFTDIDDKMILRAEADGITVAELATQMIEAYFEDADQLNIRRASIHPRATESIPAITDMIQVLLDKGYAYITSDGVYFEMSKAPDYGRLSHHKLDDLETGASERGGLSDEKRGEMDFVLWKFQKPGEPAWDTPWGAGRPGWHIECSAMIKENLGETIDIHCGGQDLVFPHHENEIAQSEAANGKPFVRYWLHNGFVNVDRQKMAKSKGNFFLVRDLLKLYPPNVLRFFILQAHYRMPINFSNDNLDAAQAGWDRIKGSISNLQFIAASRPEKQGDSPAADSLCAAIKQARLDWQEAMDDDLNTADAYAAIFELVREANTAATDETVAAETLLAARATLLELLDVMGLDPLAEVTQAIPDEIMALVEARDAAKKEKNYAAADQLRNEIQAAGYRIEDTPQGPKVEAL